MSAENNVDLFIHREGMPPKAVLATANENVEEVLKRSGLEILSGLHVFVGESISALDHAASDADDGEDTHEPIDLSSLVGELGLQRSGHVHCHRCRHVAVIVNYQTRHVRHRFSPATTIRTATAWAHHRFHLTDTDAEKFILQVCNSDRRPRPDLHLGELVHAPDCKLCFDLVPDKKIEG